MRTVEIPKRSGGTRTICVPTRERKKACREMIPTLHRLARAVCDLDVVHGFAELRSPVTNAILHVGFDFTLTFDLKDFFDTVKRPTSAIGKRRSLSQHQFSKCWHNGVAMQGLPTSPIVANIMAAPMDKAILSETRGRRIVYTRYADDLSFSFDEGFWTERFDNTGCNTGVWLKRVISRIVRIHGFELNQGKTRLQSARSGRRIITGVAVGKKGIYPTRRMKRRLRAAIHNAKTGRVKHFPSRQWMRYVKQRRYHKQAILPKPVWLKRWLSKRVAGLEEWAKLKPPMVGTRTATRIAVAHSKDPVEALKEVARRGQKPRSAK